MADKRPYIPYGRQSIADDDIELVVDVLRSDWLTCGPRVQEFESALAGYCGAKHAIAVSSGTAALHVSMLAAGVGSGDTVLTTPNTFLASANCGEYVGAKVDFVDIDPLTGNMDPIVLAKMMDDNVAAVIPVDFAGYPCNMLDIAAAARQSGAIVVEDACHALGTQSLMAGEWCKAGGHAWADMTVFSFHPVKTIAAGEGGAILTDDDALAEKCRLFRNHGMVKPQEAASEKPWYYEMSELGYNYRMTDIQCALGLSQLKKLDSFVERRARIVEMYSNAFAGLTNVRVPYCDSDNVKAAWHLYVLQIDYEAIGKSRAEVMSELRESGVGTQVHYVPVHLQPYYREHYGYTEGKCPNSEERYKRCLSIPLYPAMSDDDVERVISSVKKVVSG